MEESGGTIIVQVNAPSTIHLNQIFAESLASYFGMDSAAVGSGSSSDGTSGTSSPPPGTSPPPSGSDGGSSTYLPATGDGSLTGHFEMKTKDESKSDYQWKQTNFSRFANVTYSHVQKDVTKIGNKAINSETKESEYTADFLDNGRTSYNTTKTKTTFSEWNNNTFGSSVVDYRLAGSTETDFYSNFNGEHNSTTIDEEGDTGESIHDNVGKTMKTETSASATANGFSSQTTTENYVVVPLLTMNAIIQKVTTETITEGVSGTHSSNINLLDISGNGNQYAGGIKLNRTTGMTSVSTFTMQSPVTQNSPSVAEEKHWGANFQVSELKTFAYGSSEDPEEYSAIVKTLWTRVWGGMKLALGIVEVVGGVYAVTTGVGAPFGVIAIIHGLDTMYAGATQLVSGDATDTLTKRLANSAFLAHFKPANEHEKKELEKFGEGVDALVGIVGGLGGAGAAFNGAKQLKNGAATGKMAAGLDDAGEALQGASFSSKADDFRHSAGYSFGSKTKPWKGKYGEAWVDNGLKGQAHTGPPLYEESDWLVFRLLGVQKISFPKANYGIAKNLSGAEFAAITRHEKAHIWFFNAFPRTTLWASSRIGTPGKGISRFLIELHGNMAEHNGHIGKAFLGAIGKDTPWEVLAIDAGYSVGAVGVGLDGYFTWKWLKQ